LIFDLLEINMKSQELEDRLIHFAVMVIGVVGGNDLIDE